jgi:hypothetical protein
MRESMTFAITHILLEGSPSQVGQAIVAGISIKMSAFHPRRTWASKGFQLHSMNQRAMMTPIPA